MTMVFAGRSPLIRYGSAFITVAAALLVVLVLRPFMEPVSIAAFMVAVVVTAAYLGTGPGLLASILSVIAIDFGILAPIYPPGLHPQDVFLFLIFCTLAYTGGRTYGRSQSREDSDARNRAESHLAAIVESSDDAIISKDLNGYITSWNKAAERMYGYTADEIVGRNIAVIIPPDWPNDVPQILERIRRGERIDHYETRRMAKDGTVLDVSLSVSPIYDEKQRIVGASKIARDISDRIRADRERIELLNREQEARTEAEKAVRMRDEFLSVAAHELRTPVTSLRGFTQTLLRQFQRDGQIAPDRMRASLERLNQQSQRLTSLTNQLLDISRIDEGKLELDCSITDVAALTQEIVTVEQSMTTQHTITLTRPEHLNATIDPLRFEQVITNLIDNAIKYSPDGGPIAVELTSSDNMLRLTVTDHGIGIPVTHRKDIFNRFFQAHDNPSVGGIGLGLYISHQIVALHNGRLWAEHPAEGGTRFVVTLPCKPTS